MTAIEVITKEDLKEFKNELIGEIRSILNPEQNLGKKWLKSQEVRKLLGISAGTLQNLRINGTLRYTRVGSILYYKVEDINLLLEGGLK
ncbi:helix-turn-helix domain-containing protein [Pedobacter sp. V48]|uniref:helix-turn-helix domain-containing protein n=1 Tax=Pedobacter sp. V48 TaxID=509635 RepID=UPI0004B59E79|nr:helix-turn-helix domain-containing protein [Pedobacter sp. V48]